MYRYFRNLENISRICQNLEKNKIYFLMSEAKFDAERGIFLQNDSPPCDCTLYRMCWNLSSLIPYPGSASNNFPASSKHGLFLISIEHGNKQAVDINQSEILIWILIFFQNWQLRIQSVRMDDSGDYMCQVFFLLKKIMSLFYICVLIYCMFRNIYDTC